MQKVLNFAHFNPKNTHTSLCKNVQIYTTVLQMDSNRAYIHGYCSCANDFFKFFFSLLCQTTHPLHLQQLAASPMSTTTSSFPNVYNNLAQQNNKKEAENNHPTTKPSNLAQKINPKSMEKQLENPTQNQDKPTGKPNSKSIKTHQETQPKLIIDTPQNHQNCSKSRSKFIKPIYKFI